MAVVLGDDFRDYLYALKKEMPRERHYICVVNPLEGMLDYEVLIKDQSSTFVDVDVERDNLAWLFYTSGTTGKPKGHAHPPCPDDNDHELFR